MTERERYIRTMTYQPVDRPPLHLVGAWPDTVARWHQEGLPHGVDINDHLGVKPLRSVNISPNTALHPPFEETTLEKSDTIRIYRDRYVAPVRDFVDHTSMPEWLEFPVKSPDDLRRLLDEHYQVDQLADRFPADYEETVRRAATSGDVVVIDGGCYYWTLRSVAGVEYASYLFYDAPELVDELFERYHTVVMEGLRRATALTRIDCIGFGEDIAFKTGPLISPAMFRDLILPRYRSLMDAARSHGIELTWYDSDGDLRAFIPDTLAIGINTYAPCEVAAGMAPTALRKKFGRDVRMIGGIDKREIAKGRAAIDAELERNRPVIEEGGYVPAIDHSVSADISFADYSYFVERVLGVLDG